MPGRDIVVVGTSAGGVEALTQLVRGMRAGLPAAIFIVQHFPAGVPSMLPSILNRSAPLPAAHAVDGENIRPGRIYVAPPGYHLLLRRGYVRLTTGPRENGHRPAVDPLFRSAAMSYGSRVIGVILSGILDDGTSGLRMVKRFGGVAVVQDPNDAMYPSMPGNAIDQVDVDHVLPVTDMGGLLERLTRETVLEEPVYAPVRGLLKPGRDESDEEAGLIMSAEEAGTPSEYTCPECGGALWEMPDGETIRYQCRVGHAFSPDSLAAQNGDMVETALWAAVRALEEQVSLSRRMASRARKGGHVLTADRYDRRAAEAEGQATTVRDILLSNPGQQAELAPQSTGRGAVEE